MTPPLAGRFLTTGRPGKPKPFFFFFFYFLFFQDIPTPVFFFFLNLFSSLKKKKKTPNSGYKLLLKSKQLCYNNILYKKDNCAIVIRKVECNSKHVGLGIVFKFATDVKEILYDLQLFEQK